MRDLFVFLFSVSFSLHVYLGGRDIIWDIMNQMWCSNRGFWSNQYEISVIHTCWRTTLGYAKIVGSDFFMCYRGEEYE